MFSFLSRLGAFIRRAFASPHFIGSLIWIFKTTLAALIAVYVAYLFR